MTDADVAHLVGLPKLVSLDLRDTLVTDAALPHLKQLKRLERLELNERSSADANVKELQRALLRTDIRNNEG